MRKLVVVAAVMGAAAGALAGVPVARSQAAARAQREEAAARVDARQRELLRRLLVAERTLAHGAP